MGNKARKDTPHAIRGTQDMIGEGGDLPEIVMQQVEHFFTHYKDLEPEKWVRVGKWGDAEEARRIVVESIERLSAKT